MFNTLQCKLTTVCLCTCVAAYLPQFLCRYDTAKRVPQKVQTIRRGISVCRGKGPFTFFSTAVHIFRAFKGVC